ncbi:MAG TPA: thioredoxin fold domain-containing protein [Chthoniobacterales bacterium]|nr:thioredoxin fold domain-containing protein [Chthoniobacterales bacterium]
MAEVARVNSRRAILCSVLVAVFGLVTSANTGADWLTDYKKAQEEAKASNKLVLLNFTGSDWCGWCIKLDREVFSTTQFKDYATKNLVLMEADFPRAKPQSASVRKQNEELAMRYQVIGFPTIVVLNGDGKVVGELGYTPGGPSAFIAELEKLRKG